MRLVRVISLWACVIAGTFAQNSAKAQDSYQDSPSDNDYFVGITPLSPSVWNNFNEETKVDSDLQTYLFRDAYLTEAGHDLLKRDSRMFLVPLDDLSSTQQRTMSPLRREDEEKARRDYAEAVKSVVINKGLFEYTVQLLGMQKLREGVKKIEKAVSLDVTLSPTAPATEKKKVTRNLHPWRFRGVALPYQRSYRIGFTNSIWSTDVQGGAPSGEGDKLYGEVSARWGRYKQANVYQVLTNTAITSFTIFFQGDVSLTFAVRKNFSNETTDAEDIDPENPSSINNTDTTNETQANVGLTYIF